MSFNLTEPRRPLALIALLGLVLLLTGCTALPYQEATWEEGPRDGVVLKTPHYDLHTTIRDTEFLRALANEMESSHSIYRNLAPASTDEAKSPLSGFIYAYRDEWIDYTRRTAGPTAAVYLQINRGGYAHGSAFATFFHGTPQTLAVCRHEGLHQYIATGFKHRPPPFLEEGIATLFEAGFEGDELSRPLRNGLRNNRLAEAARRERLWPLSTLLAMHAGDVIGTDHRQIDTFYAQAWALARFLAEDDAYRPKFLAMLAAYSRGDIGRTPPPRVFEHYLGKPFDEIEADYRAYIARLTGTDKAS